MWGRNCTLSSRLLFPRPVPCCAAPTLEQMCKNQGELSNEMFSCERLGPKLSDSPAPVPRCWVQMQKDSESRHPAGFGFESVRCAGSNTSKWSFVRNTMMTQFRKKRTSRMETAEVCCVWEASGAGNGSRASGICSHIESL